jgi:hypothetical protein
VLPHLNHGPQVDIRGETIHQIFDELRYFHLVKILDSFDPYFGSDSVRNVPVVRMTLWQMKLRFTN